jgi:hypothetical protein
MTVPLHNVGLYVFAVAQSALSAAQNFKLRLLCLFFIIFAILSRMFIAILSLCLLFIVSFFILLHLTVKLVSKSM